MLGLVSMWFWPLEREASWAPLLWGGGQIGELQRPRRAELGWETGRDRFGRVWTGLDR